LLLIESFTASEQLCGLFQIDLHLVAEKQRAAKIDGEKVLGKPVSLAVSVFDNYDAAPRRYLHGLVSRFFHLDNDDVVFSHYRAEVMPWLWLLTLDSKCRIFQTKTIPEIVKAIFDEYKAHFPYLVSYTDKLTKSYTKLDYSVQYQDSSFQFVSRLLEEEGIFYYFEHTRNHHTLVLADSPAAFKLCNDQPQAHLVRKRGSANLKNPVLSWEVKHEIRPGKYTMRDYHFQMPTKDLEVGEPTILPIDAGKPLEIYDYPGWESPTCINARETRTTRKTGIRVRSVPRVKASLRLFCSCWRGT
jgi:type VI secretion system secreted protein VgrG